MKKNKIILSVSIVILLCLTIISLKQFSHKSIANKSKSELNSQVISDSISKIASEYP